MLRRAMVLLACAALAAGCGGKPVPATSVTGTVQGKSFSSPTAFFSVAQGATRDQVLVLISDDPEACGRLTPVANLGRSGVAFPDAGVTSSSTGPVTFVNTAGRIPSLFLKLNEDNAFYSNNRAIGDNLIADFDPGSTCTASASDGGTATDGGMIGEDGGVPDAGRVICSNNVVVAAVNGTGRMESSDVSGTSSDNAQGSFDLTFPSGDKMTGTFHASRCAALQGGCASASGSTLWPLLAIALGLGLTRRRAAT